MKKIWKVIIVLVCVIILFFLFKRINRTDEKYFNTVELDTNNVIINTLSKNYLDTIVNIGLKELEIKNIKVVLLSLSYNEKSKLSNELELMAYIKEHEGIYYILIDENLDRGKMIEILSHELIHLKQYKSGRLTLINNQPTWENVVYSLDYFPYDKRPWEIEAFKEGQTLNQKLNKILY